MSVPAEQMGAAPPGAPPMGGPEPSPAAAPTMTPQEPKGEQASSDAKIIMIRRIAEQALSAYQKDHEKYKALLSVITTLTKAFKIGEDKAEQIVPAEVKTMLMGPSGDANPSPGPAAKPQGAAPMAA